MVHESLTYNNRVYIQTLSLGNTPGGTLRDIGQGGLGWQRRSAQSAGDPQSLSL